MSGHRWRCCCRDTFSLKIRRLTQAVTVKVPYASYTITVSDVCPDVTIFCTADNKEAIYSCTKITKKITLCRAARIRSLSPPVLSAQFGVIPNSDYTSQQDFGTRKVYCFSNVTFHAESKYAIKIFPSPTVFVQWPFQLLIFRNFWYFHQWFFYTWTNILNGFEQRVVTYNLPLSYL